MAEIRIVGTSHIAAESIKTVKKEILERKPDIVAIELDIQRLPHLYSKTKRKMKLTDIAKIGFGGYLFNKLGGYLQKKLGSDVGLMPGADMKQAIEEANKAGAEIYLIDRPVQRTLKQLSAEIGLIEKLKIVFAFAGGFAMPAPKGLKSLDLKKVPAPKTIDFLIKVLKKSFPGLYRVLVEERNEYMSKQLLALAKHFPESSILAVVGAGHVEGINKNLNDRFFKNKTLKEVNGQSARLQLVRIKPQ